MFDKYVPQELDTLCVFRRQSFQKNVSLSIEKSQNLELNLTNVKLSNYINKVYRKLSSLCRPFGKYLGLFSLYIVLSEKYIL